MKKIYICCPASCYTGGPTLAHQLCYVLNQRGVSASMWYISGRRKWRIINPVHSAYKHFDNPYVISRPRDVSENIIIAVETNVKILQRFKFAKKYIWWMSVDNYFLSMTSLWCTLKKVLFKFTPPINYCKKFRNKKKYTIIYHPDINHLVQSEYARLFLLDERIKSKKIHYLSDYLESEILESNINTTIRDDKIVLYNPKKGFEYTNKLIHMMPDVTWIPIENMSKKKVIELLLHSKLYVDFGNHPGKDRFPREAVACGCCIITGKNGAAKNNVDIPIDEDYKIEATNQNLTIIVEKIRYILNNYESCAEDFLHYKKLIMLEKETFVKNAVDLFCFKKN